MPTLTHGLALTVCEPSAAGRARTQSHGSAGRKRARLGRLRAPTQVRRRGRAGACRAARRAAGGGAKRLNAPVDFVASGVLEPGQPPCAVMSPALAAAAAPAAALCDAALADVGMALADVGMALAEDALCWDAGPCAGTPIRGPVGLGFACAPPALPSLAAERGAHRLHAPTLVLWGCRECCVTGLLVFSATSPVPLPLPYAHPCKPHCS